ncbi:non-ribosomal peptide synthetase [Falsiroseomonas stagni]|uniref:Amino acid adenylation domain-containing protein n=1 Tax=Falsiroseomonas stagni DSM 19981 TaxID=1123062 RepID=A0A1I3ZLM9_9PROT|nr:non-ribosomal peptide synthetase [Falsiroseomonas stagni]SFK44601.1 amino acid adenylation domain-containing protein [Falsiroseomonas stagni DSM 19981]
MLDRPAMTPMQQAVVALQRLRARNAELERANSAPIAIIGMGCRYPAGSDSPDAMWQALLEGRDGSREVPRDRWDIDALYDPEPGRAGRMYVRKSCFLDRVDGFEPLFFRISPREAIGIDPQQRLLLEVTWEALEDAGIAPPSLVGSRTGVYVGISTNDYSALLSRTAHGSGSNAAAGAGNAASVASGRISYSFGFQGPCMAVDTACSSSLVVTHLAVQALRARECGIAIVAGVNLMLTPDITINFCLGRMLSPDGACKTFDAGADGYVRGEGCGALVLKRLSDAVADGDRVLAVIRGSAVNQDGRSAGLTAPNGPAQEAVIRAALANAGLTPDDIDAIEAHGTGTALGDPIEMHALRAVFGTRADRPLHVASVKTNIGHCEAAAGTAGLIKAALMLQHQVIPPSLHFTRLNPHIDLAGADIRVPTTPVHGGVRRVGVSSFGFSGTNVHIVLEAPPPPPVIEAEPGDAPVLFLSARTEPALRALIARYRDHLATTTDRFGDICHTARVGRARLPWWVAVRAPGELATAIPSNAPPPSLPPTQGRRVALPTTPFQRERFWIDAPAEALPAATPDDDGAHPLLGRPLSLPLSAERRWASIIDLKRPATAFLAEHRIEDQAILPASAYVEMALAAFPGQAIEALEITAPLRLSEATPAHLHTIAADGVFRILSHRPEDPAAAPVIHATGRLVPRPAPAMPPAAAGDTPVDAAALYDALRQRGIQHGPAFRLLGTIRRGPGMASATLAPAAPEPRFALHPAMLDAAFQLVAAAVAAEAGVTLIPGGIGHVALHRRPGAAPRAAVTARPDGDGITADLVLLDDEGVALEVRGLRFLPRPGSRAFWQEARHPAPLLEGLAPPAFLPSTARLGAALAPEATRLAALHDMDAYARQGEALESVATAYVVQALRRLGLPFKPGAQLTFGALSEALGIAERHHRLFRRLLSMLAEDGILKRDGRRWTVLRAPPEAAPAIDALLAAAPAMQGEVAVLRRCGDALAEVLAGRVEPLSLLFPANEAGAGAFYETSAYAHTVNGLLRAAAARLAAATPKGRRLRVVEVGAGTGGATGALLEALPEAARHYRFTDVSQAFLAAATRKFAGANLSTALLDIERDPAAQGFAPGCADVVLAANVLHATADLGATIAHIRGLLAPGGVLLLVESTARRRWIDIVFGLTEGWWRFTDTTRRPDHPLLTLDYWRALLTESGFEVPGDATGEVILARRPLERPAAGPTWHVAGEAGRAAALLAGAGARLASASQAESLLHILPPAAATAPGQEALLADLVSIAREAMARPIPPRLVIVADGTLGHAGLPGFARSLALEAPALAPRLLVAPPSAEALVDEVLAGDGEAEVGWDAEGRRTVPRLRAAPAPRAPDRVGGAWLITGGSGGLAREIASWLAAHGATRFILLSRRPATPPALPIPVQHIAADAADAAVIARLVAGTPDLQGIVHAAGLLADAPIAAQDEATIAPVLRAKIAGALALDAAIRALPDSARPRHLVFCASAAGVIGSARQANHAFASAFLDGLASLRRAEGLPVLSLDWGVWRGTGSAAALGFDRQAEGLGLGSIAPEEGQRLFGAALGADAARLILLPSVDWRRFAALFGATPPGLFRDVATAPAPRAPTPAAAKPKPQPAAAPAMPRADVARIVAEVLGLSGAVSLDTPLHDLGLDSLMAVEIRNRLAAEAGLDISVRALIEGATIASLSPAGIAPPAPAPARGDVTRIVAEVLGLSGAVSLDTPLHDLGLDSLMAVEIRNRLAAEAGIEISVRALIEGATIASLLPAAAAPAVPARGNVARIVAEVLGLATLPDAGTPLHDLGLDSLMAVEIRNRFAAEAGIDVAVRTLIEGASIASLLGTAPAPAATPPTATSSQLQPDLANRHDPFPLTDMQQAYWLGRRGDLALGATACTLYTEFDSTVIDLARAEAALNTLIRRHDMLRAIILPDGTQRILPAVPHYAIDILDIEGDPAPTLATRRETLAARVADTDQWPLFDIRATRFGATTRLHLSFDLIALDAASIHALRQEWGLLYENPDATLSPIGISFRDHVLAEIAFRDSAAYRRDLAYWNARRLPPGPDLPLLGDMADGTRRPFRRHRAILPRDQAEALRREARAHGLTLPTLLAAAYAETLAAWARQDRFCLTVTAFNRPPRHPDMPRVLGDFTSTILLEVDARPAGFAARAEALARRLAEDMDHATVSGIEVLRQAARQSGEAAAYSPYVFTSALGFRRAGDAPATDATGFDRLGQTVFNVSSTPQVVIDHQVSEEDGQLLCSWDVVESLFPPGTVPAMVAAWRGLLDELATGRGWNRSVAAMLPAQSRAPLLPAAAPELLHAGFERQAAANPGATALLTPDIALDYATLDAAAAHLAAVLVQRLQGDTRDRLVAIGYPKGWRQIVAVLATLKAGAAYLPVDPALPADRRALLVQRGEALLVEDDALADAALVAARAGAARPAVPPVEDPTRLAYVIYTSGSTGEPKGVMIEHAAAIATVAEVNRRWAIGPGDRALGLSQLGFDLSVWDIFGILAAGGALVLPAPEASRDPSHWGDLCARHAVTVWNSVPALVAMQVEYGLPPDHRLRLVMMSGDWVPLDLIPKLRAQAPAARLVALGGATEAAIWSNAHEVAALDPDWPSIPYGLPLAGQMLHVVNARGEPCPDWTIGEIEIAGAGLARGYWRDPALTAARFIRNPLTGERRYRTGDLGRFRRHGDATGPTPIEFLGREDFQVKVQGYRIELGEIEAALASHPAVAQAVVTAPALGGGRDRVLHGFYVPKPDGAPDELGAALRAHLRQRLPAYMVPASLTPIDHVPLSSNGKVDRKALVPALRDGAAGQGPGLARDVAAEVAAVLGVAVPEPDRSLFELGATSLSLVSIQRRLAERYGRAIPLQAIFARPTVNALAEELQSGRAATSTLVTFGATADDRRPRLVLMPGILSLPFYLRDLAAAVSRFAIVSLQLPGMAEGETPLDSVEAQADHVVARLRQEQRHGPYLLAGHSFGGLIAIEVARRLRAMGEDVPLLLLGDTLRTTARFDAVQSDEIAYTAMTRALEALYGATVPMEGMDAETRFRRTAAAMQEAGRFGPLTLPLDRMVAMFKANFRALGAYRPAPIEGDVALIRSEEGFPPELAGLDSAAAAQDPFLGWGDVVQGRLLLRRLPGDHLAMLSAENLPLMAALMTELAEAAIAIDPALLKAGTEAARRHGQPVTDAEFAVTADTFRDQAAAAAAAAIRHITGGAPPMDAATLITRHGIIPRYRFWLDRMLPEVARIGADAVPPSTHAIIGVDRLGFEPAARDFLDRVIAGLPGLLTGSEHAASIYLADETPDVYGKLFAEPNAAIAAILARLAAQRPIEVLELGGGLGTTLAAIEPHLPPGRIRYRFTDLNAHLLRRAARRFAGRDWLEFGTLDMDQPPADARRYDVVLASSALHAAPDIARALRHARAWLKPDGLLLLLEETRFFPWFDLGMGLQAGFDDRTDLALRPLHPLLSRDQWRDALAEAGFRASDVIAAEGSVAARLGFDVILAAP